MATAALSTAPSPAPGQAGAGGASAGTGWRLPAPSIICWCCVLGSAIGPYLLPFDDTYIDIMNRFAPPFTGAHILGTDELGRDVLARLLMGGASRSSVGFVAMVLAWWSASSSARSPASMAAWSARC